METSTSRNWLFWLWYTVLLGSFCLTAFMWLWLAVKVLPILGDRTYETQFFSTANAIGLGSFSAGVLALLSLYWLNKDLLPKVTARASRYAWIVALAYMISIAVYLWLPAIGNSLGFKFAWMELNLDRLPGMMVMAGLAVFTCVVSNDLRRRACCASEQSELRSAK
jgi:hypothetical protein